MAKYARAFSGIREWFDEKLESNDEFKQWYSDHQNYINKSLKVISDHVDNPGNFVVEFQYNTIFVNPGHLLNSDIKQTDIQLFFRITVKSPSLGWHIRDCSDIKGSAVKHISVPIDGIDYPVFGMVIKTELDLAVTSNSVYNGDLIHCETGPCNIVNGEEKFYLYNTKIDHNDYWEIVKSPKLIEQYRSLYLLSKW